MDAANTSMLLLLLAAVGANAEPSPANCDGLNVTLHNKDLHKVLGDWVLVWSVADHQEGWDLLPNVSSSHVELRLLPDNRTLTFTERNMFTNSSCTNFVINMTIPADDDDHHHSLHAVSATVETDGVVTPYNETGDADFFETCDDCMSLIFRGPEGRYLLNYKREGHHQDVDKLKEHHDDHRKMAECLGFPHENPFSYDGAADFCHKKSAAEPEAAADPAEHVESAAES